MENELKIKYARDYMKTHIKMITRVMMLRMWNVYMRSVTYCTQ